MDEPRTPVRDALAEVIAERARKRYRPSADDLIALHEGGLSEEEAERVLDYLALHPEEAQAVAAFDEDDFALPRPGEVELTESELEARLAALKKQAALTEEPAPPQAIAEAPKAPEAPPAPAAAPPRPKTVRWQKLAAVVGWLVVGGLGGHGLFGGLPSGASPAVVRLDSDVTRSAESKASSRTERRDVVFVLGRHELGDYRRVRLEIRRKTDPPGRSFRKGEARHVGGKTSGDEELSWFFPSADLGKEGVFVDLYGLDDDSPVLIATYTY